MIEKTKIELFKTFRNMYTCDHKIFCGIINSKKLPEQDDKNVFSMTTSAVYNALAFPDEKVINSDNKEKIMLLNNKKNYLPVPSVEAASFLKNASYSFYLASKMIEKSNDLKIIILDTYFCALEAKNESTNFFDLLERDILNPNQSISVKTKDYTREYEDLIDDIKTNIEKIELKLLSLNYKTTTIKNFLQVVDESYYGTYYVYKIAPMTELFNSKTYNFHIDDLRAHALKYEYMLDILQNTKIKYNYKIMKEFVLSAGYMARRKVFEKYKRYPESFPSIAKCASLVNQKTKKTIDNNNTKKEF